MNLESLVAIVFQKNANAVCCKFVQSTANIALLRRALVEYNKVLWLIYGKVLKIICLLDYILQFIRENQVDVFLVDTLVFRPFGMTIISQLLLKLLLN